MEAVCICRITLAFTSNIISMIARNTSINLGTHAISSTWDKSTSNCSRVWIWAVISRIAAWHSWWMVRMGIVSVGRCDDCNGFFSKGLHKSGAGMDWMALLDSAFATVVQCSRETEGIVDKSTFGFWYHLYFSEYSRSHSLHLKIIPSTDNSNTKLHPSYLCEDLEIVAARNS